MTRSTSILTAAGVGLAGVLGGGILALSSTASAAEGAGSSGDSSSLVDRPPGSGDRGPHGTPVDDDVAEQVEVAVLAAYDGATVDRVEQKGTDADGQPVYEAHLTTADAEHVHVLLDDSLTVTGEAERPEGSSRSGGSRGAHGTPADDAAVAEVEAAVAAAYDGAEADRVMEVTDADGETMYVAHVETAEDTRLHVLLDDSFGVVDELERPARSERGERLDGERPPLGDTAGGGGTDDSGDRAGGPASTGSVLTDA